MMRENRPCVTGVPGEPREPFGVPENRPCVTLCQLGVPKVVKVGIIKAYRRGDPDCFLQPEKSMKP